MQISCKLLASNIDEELTNFEQTVNSNLRYKAFTAFLHRTITARNNSLQIKHTKKLCQLYNGYVPYKDQKSRYVNLTNVNIEPSVEEVFQLGIKCHIKTKSSQLDRKIELEKLYASIKTHEKNKAVTILDDEQLKTELKRHGLKQINDFNKDVLSKEHYIKIIIFVLCIFRYFCVIWMAPFVP